MARISEKRVREAAYDLVGMRWGYSNPNVGELAGEDMQQWQVSGSRVDRRGIAQRALAQPTRKKTSGIQRQISNALK